MCTHPLAANQKLDVKGCPKNKQTKTRKAGGNEKNDKNGAFSLAFLLLFIIDDYLVETLYSTL